MDAELFKGDGVKPELVTVRSASGVPETIPLYKDGDTVSGFVTVTPGFGKKVDHQGIKIELLGQIEAYYDKGSFYDFIAAVREVAGPGEIKEETKFDFEFPNHLKVISSLEFENEKKIKLLAFPIHLFQNWIFF